MVAFKPCCPESVNLVLPGPIMQAIQVTWFNFTNQLHALLSDYALCGNLKNLEVNLVAPFAKYAPPSGQLSTFFYGSIYNLAYKNCFLFKKPNNFLIGIIFGCDKTKLRKEAKPAIGHLCFLFLFVNFQSLGKVWDTYLIYP
jgi:hypothetical protein